MRRGRATSRRERRRSVRGGASCGARGSHLLTCECPGRSCVASHSTHPHGPRAPPVPIVAPPPARRSPAGPPLRGKATRWRRGNPLAPARCDPRTAATSGPRMHQTEGRDDGICPGHRSPPEAGSRPARVAQLIYPRPRWANPAGLFARNRASMPAPAVEPALPVGHRARDRAAAAHRPDNRDGPGALSVERDRARPVHPLAALEQRRIHPRLPLVVEPLGEDAQVASSVTGASLLHGRPTVAPVSLRTWRDTRRRPRPRRS